MPGMRALMSSLMQALVGSLLALAPARYWRDLERRADVRQYAMVSAILTLLAGIIIGVPAFLRHASTAASAASRLTVEAATAQIQRPDGPEVTTLFARVLNAMFVMTFVATPAGFVTTYLACSGLFRVACASFDDPIGDPALTLLDSTVRQLRVRAAGSLERTQQRRRFGSAVPDEVVRAAAAGFANADFVVIASRPKERWTADVVIIADDGAYRVVDVVERTIDRHARVLYVLRRKTDSEIMRRTIRYALPPYF
jgi:hypothetical protein